MTVTSSTAREDAVVAAVPQGLWIGGVPRPASGGAVLPVDDPSTGEVLAEVADASVEDGRLALDTAVAAQAGLGGRRRRGSGARSCGGRSS